MSTKIISLSLDEDDVEYLDYLVKKTGFNNRSELIRKAVRQYIDIEKLAEKKSLTHNDLISIIGQNNKKGKFAI